MRNYKILIKLLEDFLNSYFCLFQMFKLDEENPKIKMEFENPFEPIVKIETEDEPFETKENLKKQKIKEEHDEAYPCAKRPKLPPLVPIQNNPKFVCHWCHKKFASKNEVANHLKNQHATNDDGIIDDPSDKENPPKKQISKKHREISISNAKRAFVVDNKGFVIDAPYTCAKCNCPFQKEITWYSHTMKCGN